MPRSWSSSRKMHPLRWTFYMEDCVRVLRRERETELDFVLAHQAKCHELSNQITTLADEKKSPMTYSEKAMQLQLQNIRQSLPATMQSNSER